MTCDPGFAAREDRDPSSAEGPQSSLRGSCLWVPDIGFRDFGSTGEGRFAPWLSGPALGWNRDRGPPRLDRPVLVLPEAPVRGDAQVATDAGDQLADRAVGEIGIVVVSLET